MAACGSSSSTASKQVPLSAHQTLVFAVAGGTAGGLGSEGGATANEISSFEKAHPNIKVKVIPLSETSDSARQQVTQYFLAGSAIPDVLDADTAWPAAFARAGWIAPLNKFGIQNTAFMPGSLAATSYKGNLSAAMWYFNTEGLYYRTDLIKTPPKTPQQLVSDAEAALRRDPKLREGLAFEGNKYEGLVTVFIDLMAAFGGKFDPAHMDTPGNLAAVQYLHDLVDKYKIAPQAVSSWTEQNVQDAFVSGQTAFATNWPYLIAVANGKGSSVIGKTGFVPFPTENGAGTATLASDSLVINAHSTHQPAAAAFIKWFLTPSQQIQRAITSGDPPSVSGAYTSALFKKAPYFKIDLSVFKHANPRLVSPTYQQVSTDVQDMLSSVIANQQTPAQALKATSQQLAQLPAS